MVITHEKTALPLAENTAKVTGIRCPSQRTCCQRGVMQLVLKERAPRPCRSQVDHTISRRYAAVMHALRASTRSATGSEWRESSPEGRVGAVTWLRHLEAALKRCNLTFYCTS